MHIFSIAAAVYLISLKDGKYSRGTSDTANETRDGMLATNHIGPLLFLFSDPGYTQQWGSLIMFQRASESARAWNGVSDEIWRNMFAISSVISRLTSGHACCARVI
jgi:hypothetical protein